MFTRTKLVPPLRCYGQCPVTKATSGWQGNCQCRHQPQAIRCTLRVFVARPIQEILPLMTLHSQRLDVDVRKLSFY